MISFLPWKSLAAKQKSAKTQPMPKSEMASHERVR